MRDVREHKLPEEFNKFVTDYDNETKLALAIKLLKSIYLMEDIYYIKQAISLAETAYRFME